jgi:hypothetical protein
VIISVSFAGAPKKTADICGTFFIMFSGRCGWLTALTLTLTATQAGHHP